MVWQGGCYPHHPTAALVIGLLGCVVLAPVVVADCPYDCQQRVAVSIQELNDARKDCPELCALRVVLANGMQPHVKRASVANWPWWQSRTSV